MAFARKKLGQAVLLTSETDIYEPASTSITGVVGTLVFHNTSTSVQAKVTIYGPHSGAAASTDVIDVVNIDPLKSYACTKLVNSVIEGALSDKISALCDTASIVNAFCAGAEE